MFEKKWNNDKKKLKNRVFVTSFAESTSESHESVLRTIKQAKEHIFYIFFVTHFDGLGYLFKSR